MGVDSDAAGRLAEEGRPEECSVERLAILVVYFLKDDTDTALAQLHLDRIRRHTNVPYKIYAAANRIPDETRELLRRDEHVELCAIAPTDLRSSKEHGYYLDALLQRALQSDATHIATLDVDSFPIDDHWVETLAGLAPSGSGMAGVLRIENGDQELCHPSCIFATRDFYTRFAPTFYPFPVGDDLRAFQQATGQSADTGIDLAVQLWKQHEPWGRVLRSNRVNPHAIMAGIYGDVVFHLGGIGHGKIFRSDIAASRVHRWSRPLELIPSRFSTIAGVKKALLRRVRSRTEQRMAEQNRNVYRELREWLLADSDGLIGYLRGQTQPQAGDRIAALRAAAQLQDRGAS